MESHQQVIRLPPWQHQRPSSVNPLKTRQQYCLPEVRVGEFDQSTALSTLCSNTVFIMCRPWLLQKSKSKMPLDRPFCPITLHYSPRVLKSLYKTMEHPSGALSWIHPESPKRLDTPNWCPVGRNNGIFLSDSHYNHLWLSTRTTRRERWIQ